MNEDELSEVPQIEFREDGSVAFILPKDWAGNLADDLRRWKEIDRSWSYVSNWKRSPILRENRRESIVYGNCHETIVATLGRRNVRELLKRFPPLESEVGP